VVAQIAEILGLAVDQADGQLQPDNMPKKITKLCCDVAKRAVNIASVLIIKERKIGLLSNKSLFGASNNKEMLSAGSRLEYSCYAHNVRI